ncbi:MAG TPA: metallophosphoesterase [Longimicrobium sp.]|nr:metallophosphoesterase [Longimicrobium sp.]
MRSLTGFPLLVPFCAALLAGCGGRDGAAATAADSTATRSRSPYGALASENVRVVPVEIEVIDLPRGWDGMRIAALSDFQLGLWPDNVNVARAAVERAVAEKPDLVVLLGDYVTRGRDYTALDRVLAPLRGRTVFAVLGHTDAEQDTEGPDSTLIRASEALARNGVRVLRNQRAPFVRGRDTAYIGGVDPFTPLKPEWRQAEIFGGVPGGPRTPVLLSHMPVTAYAVPRDKYPSVLTGHTFCGQTEVPGTPRLIWVNSEVFPGTPDPSRTRIWRIRGSTVFATCGVGYSFVPVRMGAPPEVAMITLKRIDGAPRDTTGARPVNVDSLIEYFQPDTTERDSTGGTD